MDASLGGGGDGAVGIRSVVPVDDSGNASDQSVTGPAFQPDRRTVFTGDSSD